MSKRKLKRRRKNPAQEHIILVGARRRDAAGRHQSDPSGRTNTELALRRYLAANPAARGTLQVVPRFEIV